MFDDTQKKQDEENDIDPNVAPDAFVASDASVASAASGASPIEDKAAEYLTGWKRALADYDNLKKDLARERGEMRRASTVELLLHFLPVINNFEQATKHRPHLEDKSSESWVSGILMIKTQLENSIKELGAEPFGDLGEKFNPEFHESAGSRREEDREDQIILEVVQRGWKVNGKVVFPAKVIINIL
ncbi:MAG: nucleotide exchange factor GrpE [Candidatus Uhrbacteria bacterium]